MTTDISSVPERPEDTASSIPLQPLEQPPLRETTPERLAVEIGRLDAVLAGLVLILGFFLASFAVRNPDFWQHLSSGRLYAHGNFNFGVDPFSYTNADSYYVNSSWLYDLVLYGLATITGGAESPFGAAAIVAGKALLIVLLTWIMLAIRRPGQSLWAPGFFTALAVVAMSPRLILQPTLVSLLFLAVTLFILQRPRHEEQSRSEGASPLRTYWLLPPLFILWVNSDAWFLLGPCTVALFLLGQFLQKLTMPVRTGPDAPEPGQLRTLLLVLVVGTAACLVNPHHYHAFQLPAQLGFTGNVEALERDPVLKHLFDSPFSDAYFQLNAGWSVAGMSYFPLIFVGVLSFVMCVFAEFRFWRLAIWAGFLALSAWQTRNIPFFAVVAAPITALNVQDFVARVFGTVPRVTSGWKAWSLAGRAATLLLLVVALVGAWPGWLHGRVSDALQSHRVGWAIPVDSSLKQSALQIKEWRDRGLLGTDENGFNYRPDQMNYLAWFCADEKGQPAAKGFFDYRIGAYPADVTSAYVDVRAILPLNPFGGTDKGGRRINWQEIFRKYKITHLILNNTNDRNATMAWYWLLADWQQFRLVYIDGFSMIYYWNDPQRTAQESGSKLSRVDLSALAFGPDDYRAPSEGPGRPPEAAEPWTRFLHGSGPFPPEGEYSGMMTLYFDRINRVWPKGYFRVKDIATWTALAASSVAGPGVATAGAPATLTSGSFPNWLALAENPVVLNMELQGLDLGPPAAPVLAVRSAWRAVAAAPDNGEVYYRLAEAYRLLGQNQEDQWTGRRGITTGTRRQRLREAQIVAALEHDARVRTNHVETHVRLRELYMQHQFYDLALDHLRDEVRLREEDAKIAAVDMTPDERDKVQQELDKLRKAYEGLDTEVQRRRSEFEFGAANQPLASKARAAIRGGLVKKALELLTEADPVQITTNEIPFMLELLIATGRPEDARELLDPKLKAAGLPDYDWFNVVIEAALGNLGPAGEYLEEMCNRLDNTGTAFTLAPLRSLAFGPGPDMTFWFRSLNERLGMLRQVADYRVLRGLLALDEGAVDTALKSFRRALDTSGVEGLEFEAKPIAVRYVHLIQAAGGGDRKK
jgi:tetratricopeptide (TPR) repeat protein